MYRQDNDMEIIQQRPDQLCFYFVLMSCVNQINYLQERTVCVFVVGQELRAEIQMSAAVFMLSSVCFISRAFDATFVFL